MAHEQSCFVSPLGVARMPMASVSTRHLSPKSSTLTTRRKPASSRATITCNATKAGAEPATSSTNASQDEGSSYPAFQKRAHGSNGVRMVPLWRRVFSDQTTPVELFRCLVAEGDTDTHAFLLESATNEGTQGRYSFVGANPIVEVIAKESELTVIDKRLPESSRKSKMLCEDPWKYIANFMKELVCSDTGSLPQSFSGGWVGYGGYDTVRYAEPQKMPFSAAPRDDRNIPDMHMGLYQSSIICDHFSKMLYVVEWVDLLQSSSVEKAYQAGMKRLNAQVDIIIQQKLLSPLRNAFIELNVGEIAKVSQKLKSNMTKEEFIKGVEKSLYHIGEGDAFQIVISQRFEYESKVDPFNVYRSLRVINPSPYMIYMQCEDVVLVASSPEILCRVEKGVITNRPLAGTRKRGATEEEDEELEKDLLNDEKERAEHIMLVDLGRNDVGRVAQYGTVRVTELMQIERYSHVMHISSTVKGKLWDNLTSWDALRSTLPAGTVSGAPKIRAMQIIDSIEPTRRGPYGGGIGFVSFNDTMNIALALRTMVIQKKPNGKGWKYYLQAGAGLVADSDPEKEFQETVNKSMALARSIDLAEQAFS
eukprot:CAMPEP_0184692328 /NCGR_PEP_ID=MMETSP0313-20130426/855_1 /TAXON_ID=2792 /ORGANISM="Porphyridium aerugineum, Strain SAG 1380-2" /LENGTH=591 /DNA_ID=CAMNT_0027150153 /DNA_START=60 /DNA_END=1835 /DNA_ORIENTATION=+